MTEWEATCARCKCVGSHHENSASLPCCDCSCQGFVAQQGKAPHCPLCDRAVAALSDHHLIPKSRGGKETVPICEDCHRTIHAFYDNKKLKKQLNSVEALQAHPRFAAHLRWLRKRPGTTRHRTKRAKARGRHR